VNVSCLEPNQHTLLLIKFSPYKGESYLYLNVASKKLFVKDCQKDITECMLSILNIGRRVKDHNYYKLQFNSKQLVSSMITKVASIGTCLQLIKQGNIDLQMGAIKPIKKSQ